MKISIVLRDLTEKGGGERVCVNLANALSQKHQVQIISFYHSQPEISYQLSQEVDVVFLTQIGERSGGKIRAFFRRIFYRYILTFVAQKYLKDTQIILANDRALAPIFKQSNKKYIRLWHLNFPKRRKQDLLFFDALVILSAKEINKWKKIHSNIWVIPNFLPFNTEKKTQWNQKNILSIGRMDRGDQKGFLRLIEIYKKIASRYPDWKLILVGEGELQKEIEKKIQAYGLKDQILIKPFSYRIQEEYLNSSFYVMTSHFEGFPMVLMESAIFALPSIAFDICSGPSDLITHQQTGYLIPDGNLSEFALKMEEMMSSQQMRQRMGENAKQKIQKEFLQDSILPMWEDLFSSLQNRTP